jgi:inositol phosphorylceramide mannosyltransferase catalytic subunit
MTDLEFSDLDTFLLNQDNHIIHHVWFDNVTNKRKAKKEYKKLKMCRDSWKIQNPTWCHVEWNKEASYNLVKTHYSEYIELYTHYPYEIQRCDMIRYLILHRYGGFYVDMDYYCNRSFDKVLLTYRNDIYFVQSPNRIIGQDSEHVSNALIYSKKGHAFWRKLLLEMELNKEYPYFYPKHVVVMYTTGPGMINRVYSRYKYRFYLKSYPWKLFHPYGITDHILRLRQNTEIYAIHMGRGSWEDGDSKFLLTMVRDWPVFILILLIPILTFLYKMYKHYC